MFCWAEAGYPGAKNGTIGTVNQLSYVPAYCMDCNAVIIVGPRCRSCAAVQRNKARWAEHNAKKRTPLQQRYSVA